MKKMRYQAVALLLLATLLVNMVLNYGINNVLFEKSPMYLAGNVTGMLMLLVPALVLLCKAGEKSDTKCEKCGKVLRRDPDWRCKFGNPFILCPDCNETTYDGSVLEPALCSERELDRIKETAKNEGKASDFLVVTFAFAIFYIVLFGKAPYWEWIPVAIGGAICFGNFRISKEDFFEEEIRKSLFRLKNDEAYFDAVVKRQGIAKDSAWKKQEKEEGLEAVGTVLTEEEREEALTGVREISFIEKKRDSRWLLLFITGVWILLITGVYFVQHVVGFSESFPNLKQAESKKRAYIDMEQIAGAVAENGDGYIYITEAEDSVALVYISHKDFEPYRMYMEWMFSGSGEKPEKTRLYGRAYEVSDNLASFTLETLRYYFGDAFSEEVVEEMFGTHYLAVESENKVRAEYLLKGIYVLSIAAIFIGWSLKARKMKKM